MVGRYEEPSSSYAVVSYNTVVVAAAAAADNSTAAVVAALMPVEHWTAVRRCWTRRMDRCSVRMYLLQDYLHRYLPQFAAALPHLRRGCQEAACRTRQPAELIQIPRVRNMKTSLFANRVWTIGLCLPRIELLQK